MAAVRQRVKGLGAVQDVIFIASHTHSGPYLLDEYPGGTPPDWETRVLDSIVEGIVQATQETFPAKLGLGRGSVRIGFNRRYLNPDGSVKMLWANPTKISTYPVDPEVQVLRIDDMEGVVRGVIVGYSCHPVIFGPDNDHYSADFPGAMARLVSDQLPGDPMVAYFQGGCGDINPYMDKRTIQENAVELKDRVGQELGREVVDVVSRITTSDSERPSVQLAIDTLHFADRTDVDKSYDAILTVLVLNGSIGFVGYPGEPFVEFQMELKRRAGIPAFFMGYTNGYLRYFPTIRASAEGGYGAAGAVVIVEVGAGERLLYRGLNLLYQMTGQLSAKPER